MARRKQSRGECLYCGRELTRSGMARHLKTCPERYVAQVTAKGQMQPLFHLQVQDAWHGDYWLQLEMRGNAVLDELDQYLRAIWLECCGHLSVFKIGDVRYTQLFDDGYSIGEERAMDVRVRDLFAPGMTIPYEYDFGTTSALTIRVVDERQGKPTTPHPIALMGRNLAPEATCMECGEPATWICMQCFYAREDGRCELCAEHAQEHECDDYGGPMPLVNSPRVGMCGYVGPAEPPY